MANFLRRLLHKSSRSRALPERSAREIADARKRARMELAASLYFYNDEKFIVCAIADIREHGEPTVLDRDVPDDVLGLAVCDKLIAYTPRHKPSGHKLDDWPAYRASGAKSGKAFEQASTFVYVSTINTAIRIAASPRVTNDDTLRAVCTVASTQMHVDIGAAVRKAIAASATLREAGLL